MRGEKAMSYGMKSTIVRYLIYLCLKSSMDRGSANPHVRNIQFGILKIASYLDVSLVLRLGT